MIRRRIVRLAAPLIALGTVLSTTGCVVLDACPAVGYSYDGPAVIRFSPDLPSDATVSSCFGEDCRPSAVASTSEGTWEVPQEPPFVPEDALPAGEIRDLRVVAESAGSALHDGTHEIPILMEQQGVFGQCPGPFSFEPVEVEWRQ